MDYSFDSHWYRMRYGLDSDCDLSRHYKEIGLRQGFAVCFEEEADLYAQQARQKALQDLTAVCDVRMRITSYQQERTVRTHGETVFFSAISGEYDSVKIPTVLDPACDYVLFADEGVHTAGVWERRSLPAWFRDATRSSRYVKLHPHCLFPNAKLAIWLDQNVVLFDTLAEERARFLASGCAIGMFYHPTRADIKEEAAACLALHKESRELIHRQIASYCANGFDSVIVPNTNVIFYNLTHPELVSFLQGWWAELEMYSKRDQLSFGKVLREQGTSYYPLARPGICPSNHPKFGVTVHDKKKGLYACIEKTVHATLANPFYEQKERVLAPVSDVPVTIGICIHNALPALKRCLASVVANKRDIDTLFLLDDGSSEQTQAFLEDFCKKYPKTRMLRHETACGFARSSNAIVSETTTPYCILLNSDTIVTKKWAEKLVAALVATPNAAFVSPLSNAAGAQSLPTIEPEGQNTAINVLPEGISPDYMNQCLEMWAEASVYPRVPLVHGFCLGMDTKAMKRIGLFDCEHFPQGFGGEDDLALRATIFGYDNICATNTYIYHEKSQSYSDSVRIEASQKAYAMLVSLYGRERILRSVATMVHHPTLLALRKNVQELYRICSKTNTCENPE